MFRRLFLAVASALALSLCAATPAHAIPVAVIAGFIGASATSFVAIATTFVINSVIGLGLSFGLSKIIGPKAAQNQERQAAVTQLSLGEGPREAIFGRALTGGRLAFAFNYGGTYGTDWEVLDLKIADHYCDALEGFYVNDVYVAYSGDGAVAGYNSQLEVYWRPGTLTQTIPSLLTTYGGAGANDNMAGCARLVFAYKADDPNNQNPTWSAGRPGFKALVRGKRCYDPRLDSTAGGSGSQRWATPSTWTWTENAYVCRYNWVRGVYACDRVTQPEQLLIGRGLSSTLAPEANVFASANLCDEAITLLAGGTEPRYRVGGVVNSGDDFRTTEEMFAAAMAGQIVQRSGAVEIDPGQNKTPVLTITDGELVAGEPVKFSAFVSISQRVNTVVPRYVEPTQIWADYSAPVRRVLADITADGGPAEQTLSLALVTSGTQAQRCAEIARRRGRLERRGADTLGPRFSALEEGDWIELQSDRRQNGDTFVYEVQSWSRRENGRTAFELAEVATNIASWTASLDEAVPGGAVPVDLGGPAALALSGVTVTALDLNGVAAVGFSWTAPVDPAITSIRMEVRVVGMTVAAHGSTVDVNAGHAILSNGVPAQTNIEARLIPLGEAGRGFTASSWLPVTSDGFAETDLGLLAFFDAIHDAQLAAGVGVNLLVDTNFTLGFNYWRAFGDSGFTASVQTDGTSKYLQNANTTAAPGQTIAICGDNQFDSVAIVPGQLLEVSGMVGGAHLTSIELELQFADKNGVAINPPTSAEGNGFVVITTLTSFGTGIGIENATLIWGTCTAPANAARAAPYFRAVLATTAGVLRVQQPYVGKARSGQDSPTPWNPGYRGDPKADVTLANTAAAITGQGTLATASTISTAVRNSSSLLGYGGGATFTGELAADVTNAHTAAAITGQGALATAAAAAWASQISGRPTELTDGRVSAALDSAGDLARNVTTARRNSSSLLGYSGGATFTGELAADVTNAHTAAAITGQGALATAAAAAWASQITGRPTELTDGRIPAGLDGSGDLARDVTTARRNSSSLLGYSGGATFTGELAADVTNAHTAAAITGQSTWATWPQFGPSYNHNPGQAAARDVAAPLSSSSSSSVSVAAHNIYFPTQSGVVGSTTQTGLSANTAYNVFVNASSGAFSFQTGVANTFFTSQSTWISLGVQETQTGGGGYSPPITPPGGGGGALSAWNPYAQLYQY